jgi:hypothetical protein
MSKWSLERATSVVRSRFEERGVSLSYLEPKPYPEETIFVAGVAEADFALAIEVASSLDQCFKDAEFFGFVTIRKAEAALSKKPSGRSVRGVGNPKAEELANLLAARSRTSEIQPSLEYIRDASNNLEAAITARNHLIFGRRGAGKTTLMVETKRRLEAAAHATAWINVQTHRHSGPELLFMWVLSNVFERIQTHFAERTPKLLTEVATIQSDLAMLMGRTDLSRADCARLIPRAQKLIERFTTSAGCRLYIFLDDLHYLRKGDQPVLLDMVHGVTRDIDAWLKVACIKHLSRWFEHSPPTGLQTGHDAEHIDLDLTLESPSEAKLFLDRVLNVYAAHVGVPSARSIFSEDALNRLVLASGAVPRDYLVLAASAIRSAKRRQNARLAGVQDVNRAAGDQSKVKIAELEDDAASDASAGAQAIIRALARVRQFCLDEKRFTFFKVDFQDKEASQREYSLIQSLLDVRIIHLIAASLSDKQEAGRRAEVFMLDLSQFSGQRLKKRIHVLDFVDSHLVLRETTSLKAGEKGDTPKRLQDLLRKGPVFELASIPLPLMLLP